MIGMEDIAEDLVEAAKVFAIAAHGDQRYDGDRPYRVHLAAVAKEAENWGFRPEVVAAAWLHDTVEDTEVSTSDLVYYFGDEVARLVDAVTDREGKNRRERAVKTLPLIRQNGTEAVGLKLCDRIANVRASQDDPTGLLKMYRREHVTFRQALSREGELEDLWRVLDELLEV